MKKLAIISMIITLLWTVIAHAASIQYIGNGRNTPKVYITISRDNGETCEHKELKAGQVYNIQKDTTNLRINNAPYDKSKNYKIKNGDVS